MDVVFNRWESIISLLGATSHCFKRDLNSKILKRDFQQPTIMGAPSNINLSSSLYWYATLKSCKYLKSKTHLRNAQVNKYSSVKKGVFKIWQRHDPEDFSTSYIALLPFAASSVPMKHIGLLGHCLIWLILLYLKFTVDIYLFIYFCFNLFLYIMYYFYIFYAVYPVLRRIHANSSDDSYWSVYPLNIH